MSFDKYDTHQTSKSTQTKKQYNYNSSQRKNTENSKISNITPYSESRANSGTLASLVTYILVLLSHTDIIYSIFGSV